MDKLVADVELRYRSVNSAETDNSSLVIDHPELANSERNDLGSISGYHGPERPVLYQDAANRAARQALQYASCCVICSAFTQWKEVLRAQPFQGSFQTQAVWFSVEVGACRAPTAELNRAPSSGQSAGPFRWLLAVLDQ